MCVHVFVCACVCACMRACVHAYVCMLASVEVFERAFQET